MSAIKLMATGWLLIAAISTSTTTRAIATVKQCLYCCPHSLLNFVAKEADQQRRFLKLLFAAIIAAKISKP